MAENKQVTETTKKPAKPNFFIRLWTRLVKFFKDYKSELKKIVWPSREETIKSSWVVLVALTATALVIGGLDYLFGQLVLLLGKVI